LIACTYHHFNLLKHLSLYGIRIGLVSWRSHHLIENNQLEGASFKHGLPLRFKSFMWNLYDKQHNQFQCFDLRINYTLQFLISVIAPADIPANLPPTVKPNKHLILNLENVNKNWNEPYIKLHLLNKKTSVSSDILVGHVTSSQSESGLSKYLMVHE